MNKVNVRGVTLGEGRPKICVPIVGATTEEILAEAEKIAAVQGKGADLCEWRLDWFDGVWNDGALYDTAQKLRETLGDMPLLATFRTKGEGGVRPCDPSLYTELVCRIAASGLVDLVDIELFTGDCRVTEMIGAARNHGVKTILSSHDFQKTPDKDEIVSRLARMEELGADICKIAVMPQSREDVLTLLQATVERYAVSSTPLITMSMGALGAVSRVCGELTGSCLTFGALGKASAPGQVSAEKLSEMLEILSIG
jgi:3-dehydroquinate dehydratase-1